MGDDATTGRMIPGAGVPVLFGCDCETACSSCMKPEREDSDRSGLTGAAPLRSGLDLAAEVEDSVIAGLAGMGAWPLEPGLILVNPIVVFGIATGRVDRCSVGMGIRLTAGCIFRVGSDEGEGEFDFCGVPQILQKLASAASSFLHLGQQFIFYASRHAL